MIENIKKFDLHLTTQPLSMLGFKITNILNQMIRIYKYDDLIDLFPFRNNWDLLGFISNDLIIARISDRLGSGTPTVGSFKDEDLLHLNANIEAIKENKYFDVCNLLGKTWISSDRFTFIGSYKDLHISSDELINQLTDWLNGFVIDEVFKRNESRIMRSIPQAPQYDFKKIYDAMWVLECEDSCTQGTAFYLSDVGFITCQHVLGPNTHAFHPKDISKKFPIRVLSQNETIDLAIFEIKNTEVSGLTQGTADTLKVMEHILIAGYPNYRLGDSGTMTPGFVSGFRPVSGIRRILTNAPIIAGCSGGPIIDSSNRVIGVAVTGAEIMSKAQETENHGIIPIDALKHISGAYT